MHELYAYAITAILGGGLFKGLESLFRAFSESKEKKSIADAVGAKTPAEIESVSVATMAKALESAGTRISSLEDERERDKVYYQNRIKELTEQLEKVQEELHNMAAKVAELQAEAAKVLIEGKGK